MIKALAGSNIMQDARRQYGRILTDTPAAIYTRVNKKRQQ
jgi:hypothetical protein